MIEQWKSILETKGKYEVSNLGRIRTIDHHVQNRHNKKRFVKGIIRKQVKRKDGYIIAHFYLDGKKWSDYVHRLVWRYFNDKPEPNRKIVIDHIDNNKSNNRIDNLRLISNRDNTTKGMKRKENKKSRFIGVYWRQDREHWFSRILINGKRLYLGSSKCEAQAALLYLKAKLKYTGSLGEI